MSKDIDFLLRLYRLTGAASSAIKSAFVAKGKRIAELEENLREAEKSIDSLTGHLGRETDDAIALRAKLAEAKTEARIKRQQFEVALRAARNIRKWAKAERDRLREVFLLPFSALQRRYGLNFAQATKIQSAARAALTPTVADTCVWREDLDAPWITGCGEAFEFFEDGPTENRARYCQYCGKRIEVEKQEADDGES